MKTCPTCRNSFSDDLRFCLQDGTLLLDPIDPDPEGTAVLPPDISQDRTVVDTPPRVTSDSKRDSVKQLHFSAIEPASRIGCVMSVGQITAAVLLLSVGSFVALQLFRSPGDTPSTGGFPSANAAPPSHGSDPIFSNSAAPSRSPTPSPTPKSNVNTTRSPKRSG